MFQLLDPQELRPDFHENVLLEDVETHRTLNVSPDYLATTYRQRVDAHVDALRASAASVGAQQALIATDEPLDRALRKYLVFRHGRR